ncbi:MAG: LLM class flavin-dependent oxidoreductase [Candidatus Lambdaproteobacteria bacterium]|nr:LLM class flavin-dependent oxidoreductase [Candidatus Lambdaproteobacteria bacterium]
MKIGLSLTVQDPLATDMVSSLLERFAMVHHARDRGWDAVSYGQHYLNTGDSKQLQQVPLLARIQAEAGEMIGQLGIMLLNLHNPVFIAETIASLDVIWRGKLIFGVGLGYRDVEFDAFGVWKGQRVKRFEEGLTLVKRLWTEEEVSFQSDYCRLDKVRLNIRPVQQPHPPIWVGANNETAVRRAARLGDVWQINAHSPLPDIQRLLAAFRAERKAHGLPQPTVLPCAKEIFCAKDLKTAIAQAKPYLGAKYANYASWGQDKVLPGKDTFQQPFEELLKDRFVLGSPEECYEQLRPYIEELGVNYMIFRTRWVGMPLGMTLGSMQLLSDEVIPALRKLAERTARAGA